MKESRKSFFEQVEKNFPYEKVGKNYKFWLPKKVKEKIDNSVIGV